MSMLEGLVVSMTRFLPVLQITTLLEILQALS